jgi:hypothetical protein
MTISVVFDQSGSVTVGTSTAGGNVRKQTSSITGNESMGAGDVDNVATISQGSTTSFVWTGATGTSLEGLIVVVALTAVSGSGPVGHCFVL